MESDDRSNQELSSFFHDLNNLILNKSGFVVVGNLITAIQRDLVQTETISIIKQICMIQFEIYILNYLMQ